MGEKHWIDYAVAFGTIATPLLVLALTAVGWKYRQSMERKLKLEEKLRPDRIEIYNQILEPFIILFISDKAWSLDKKNKSKSKSEMAMSTMVSLEYRKVASKLSLLGSDAVVLAYNDLMQHFYGMEDASQVSSPDKMKAAMSFLGNFLLEIRKSMGNEATRIDNWGMLEWFLTDARKLRDGELPSTSDPAP